jgi:hypothetical protein
MCEYPTRPTSTDICHWGHREYILHLLDWQKGNQYKDISCQIVRWVCGNLASFWRTVTLYAAVWAVCISKRQHIHVLSNQVQSQIQFVV